MNVFLLYSQSNGNGLYDYLNVILVVGLLIFVMIYLPRLKSKQSRFDFTNELLRLTAYIINSDGKVSSQELHYTYAFFEKEFGKHKLTTYKRHLDQYLNTNSTIDKELKNINFNQDPTTKIQLLHFLVKISISDNYLAENEFIALKLICKGIGLRTQQLYSILAMYSFITEEKQNKERKQNNNHKYKRNSKSKIEEAYKVLEISNEATSKEIKKAYRKLVILYHPDKAMHLEKSIQNGAQEMYQKVTDAYDLLKSTLSFK